MIKPYTPDVPIALYIFIYKAFMHTVTQSIFTHGRTSHHVVSIHTSHNTFFFRKAFHLSIKKMLSTSDETTSPAILQ